MIGGLPNDITTYCKRLLLVVFHNNHIKLPVKLARKSITMRTTQRQGKKLAKKRKGKKYQSRRMFIAVWMKRG